ncbi:GNAT family protein [Alkalimonas sp. NCh-2]|uniref:GNAT family N-acetyltransferase n=1 Tax=Alkalimonas sp. NCh-2 TaxID=3144846 RepID=UPI0031F66C6C
MSNETFRLVPAGPEDFDIYLSLKSEPLNIYWSGFEKAPDKEGLMQHFCKALRSECREVYLLKAGNEGVGYLYLDYSAELQQVELAYGISEKWAGRGLAKIMIMQAIQKIRPGYNLLIAWIAESNIASIKTAVALGFSAGEKRERRELAQFSAPVTFIDFFRQISQNNEKA